MKSGILPHQLQDCAKSVAHDLDGFSPRPQPGHVDVGVGHSAHCVLLCRSREGLKLFLRLTERIFKRLLAAVVQRGEVDAANDGAELVGLLRRIMEDTRNHVLGRLNLFVEQARVGPSGGVVHQQLGVLELHCARSAGNIDGHQELGARHSFPSQQNRLLSVPVRHLRE